MDIVLKTEYWSDLNARAAFKRFMRTIHGLDLSLWESGPGAGTMPTHPSRSSRVTRSWRVSASTCSTASSMDARRGSPRSRVSARCRSGGAGGQMRLALRPVVERADRVEQLHDPVLARDGQEPRSALVGDGGEDAVRARVLGQLCFDLGAKIGVVGACRIEVRRLIFGGEPNRRREQSMDRLVTGVAHVVVSSRSRTPSHARAERQSSWTVERETSSTRPTRTSSVTTSAS